MKNFLNFLIEVNKLKQVPRTGWVWLEVKHPETIADHMFRVTVFTWLLAKEGKLNEKRAIEIALFHDICEVYSGDMTPYFGLLPEDKKKRKEILKRWIRLPKEEKIKRSKEKFRIEKRSLVKLLKFLKPPLAEKILFSWLDYEKGITKEGKFVKQVDKIETLVQAIEYFGTKEDTPVVGWWEEAEELVNDPLLRDLLKVIEENFYYKKKNKKLKNIESILDFIVKVNKLKQTPRTGWALRGIKQGETIAGHSFALAITSWVLPQTLKKRLSIERLVKMALSHELCEVFADDATPYEFLKSRQKMKFQKWIRLSQKEKKESFKKDFKKEKKALQELIKNLPQNSKKEIFLLWKDFKEQKSKEARYLNQFYVFNTLLQALLYWQEDKKFPIAPWWEWAFERVESSEVLELLKELKKRFYNSRQAF
ncbi:MAG TPA: HD domain-containing protein [Candidatus Parcubacteria bacterium]|nr:HD domain-containing protein [Candidatus Parcubacteria bacterium]